MNDLRIIFMGTPDFAVPSLEILVQNKLNVVAVITAPDKPQGRGQVMTGSPVKALASKYNIPVLQPPNLKSPDFIELLKRYNANLQVVVAFRMLPESVWAMPQHGTFNLHASLLPQYRGAAPINWAIINGENETGVTTFFLKHDIDTGNVIFQEKETIGENDTAGTLYDRLKIKGSDLVLKTVRAIETGNYTLTPQRESGILKHAPKIFKETCEIRWDQSAEKVRNLVRGLSPHPAAWTTLNGKTYKIFRISVTTEVTPSVRRPEHAEPGTINSDNKNYLYIRAMDSWISVDELQPEGKKRMAVQDFFRGNKI